MRRSSSRPLHLESGRRARFKDDAYKDKVADAIARAVATITARP